MKTIPNTTGQTLKDAKSWLQKAKKEVIKMQAKQKRQEIKYWRQGQKRKNWGGKARKQKY